MAKLFFFTEARYIKYKNRYYNPSGVLKYEMFKRYLRVFDEVVVVARVTDEFEVKYCIEANLVDGKNISVYELPYFHGVLSYFINRRKVRNSILLLSNSFTSQDRCLLRVPGNIGELASNVFLGRNIDYSCEVVGDPTDVFSRGASSNPFRLILKKFLTTSLKKTVYNASAVCYITSLVLPQRYPANKTAFTCIVSNVKLVDGDFVEEVKSVDLSNGIKLISIGSLEQMYKGPDLILKAVQILKANDVNISLLWLGEGKYKKDMIEISKELGIENIVNFAGFVNNKDEVNDYLDNSDIFILASRAEAQGRVVIEAMSRGKIVIATEVGGIPENVPQEFLVQKNNVNEIVEMVLKVKQIENLEYWQNINLLRAKEYREQVLEVRRDVFLKAILSNEK